MSFLRTIAVAVAAVLAANAQVLAPNLHHLRIDGPREWSDFAERPESNALEIRFESKRNEVEATLKLRRQDLKQTWMVSLNGEELAGLPGDEDDMIVYLPVPAGSLSDGENLLRIEQNTSRQAVPDDVRIGEVELDPCPRAEVLHESRLDVNVVDADSGEALSSRITIATPEGTLQSVGTESGDRLAVRPGIVYTADGKASFGLPAGEYVVYAGRGFEYSLAQAKLRLEPGRKESLRMEIRRQVPTEGYVACDTHIHTYTHSRHGDATQTERLITLAGEGIELAIATDHNKTIDYREEVRSLGLSRFFTPVIGAEVTTPSGHFNVFPFVEGAPAPDASSPEWATTLDRIFASPGVKVAILNHARDLHGQVRPFGPKLYNEAVGENLEGWRVGLNAMEIVNSGATQTDPLELARDWMTQLNRGRSITPVGSSDSHDVGRHFVGQGRTYIRAADGDPGGIDIDQATEAFVDGQVNVSYGLLTTLEVDGKWRSGELARPGDQTHVGIRVLGPHWVTADRIRLYANGLLIREEPIPVVARDARRSEGVIREVRWTIPTPSRDVHLVAVASGPGIDGPYWRTAKPYQPTSPAPSTQVLGISGAVWVDGDRDGRKTSAYDYAVRVAAEADGDLAGAVQALQDHDAAVASQAAHQLTMRGQDLTSTAARELWGAGSPAVRSGFETYLAVVEASRKVR